VEQIGDERWVPIAERDERIGEVEPELGSERGRDDAELAQIQATLERLRELHRRLGEGRLESGDWALLRALIQAEYDALESLDSDARLA
jgi:hypothetical protein